MAKNVYWVGGSKGGVGKTMVAMATIDYLQDRGDNVLLVETDTTNPDVLKAYKDSVPAERVRLDEGAGWVYLVNLLSNHPDHWVVINAAGRDNEHVSRFAETLHGMLGELDRQLVALWVINRQRDSLELLKAFMDAMPNALVHVLRNNFLGDEHKFELYNESNIRKTVEERGGKSVNFPELADRVSDDLYSNRLSIAKGLKELPIGNRAELIRWRNLVKKVMPVVLDV
jgi:hypothetical protein